MGRQAGSTYSTCARRRRAAISRFKRGLSDPVLSSSMRRQVMPVWSAVVPYTDRGVENDGDHVGEQEEKLTVGTPVRRNAPA